MTIQRNALIRPVIALLGPASIAASSVKQWKQRRTSIVAVVILGAEAKRIRKCFISISIRVQQRRNMKIQAKLANLFTILILGTLAGCSGASSKLPDVSDTIRKSLDQASLGDVTVKQDRDKGVVTLGGHVSTDADKAQAESIAKSNAAGQVVADEIAVVPPAGANEAKTVNSDLDQGIEKNLDAALVVSGFNKDVKHDVKNGVVTLTGDVNSQAKRARVESIASKVPNVTQVVNEVEVKNQKATSSK